MLPKYSKIPDIEGGETVPFVSDHQSQPRLDSHDTPPAPAASATPETAAPTYPPGPAASVPNADGTHNVTYTFEPKWPVEGKTRHAMGVLGKTKAESIAIVQRGFPQLAFYEPERIVFSIPLNDGSGWGTVMDEAWAQFGSQPPTRLRVEVEDAPGDYTRRKRRETLKILGIVVGSVVGPLLLIFILATMFG